MFDIPVAVADFGHWAQHLAAVAAKAIVVAH